MSPELTQAIRNLMSTTHWLFEQFRHELSTPELERSWTQYDNLESLLNRVSKGIPLWSDVPNEYEYIAMDGIDGAWWGYDFPPRLLNAGAWMPKVPGIMYKNLGVSSDPSIIDWRTSLEKRPDNAPYIER